MTIAARCPASSLPANNHPFLPTAQGRIWFSRWLFAHPSDVVARDLNRWLERHKHLAQDITRRQRSPNPHDSRRR